MENMTEPYYIFLDIDGTVYCHGEVLPQNRAAIRAAQAAGHKVFINTARSLADISEKILNVRWDGIVAAIGCTVVAENRIIRSARIPAPQMARVFDELTAQKIPIMAEGERVLLCNRYYPDPGHAVLLQNGGELLARFADQVLCKAFLPTVLPAELQASLARQFQFYQHTRYAEFSVRGHDKATGMQCVLSHYGADRAHCIAMGDSINDLDMLRFAGISVAMGDASQEVIDACSMVSCRADEGGVAVAMRELLHLPE